MPGERRRVVVDADVSAVPPKDSRSGRLKGYGRLGCGESGYGALSRGLLVYTHRHFSHFRLGGIGAGVG